jgi:hypothetical protein
MSALVSFGGQVKFAHALPLTPKVKTGIRAVVVYLYVVIRVVVV